MQPGCDSCCWRSLGATAGQAVVWYGGQFYALFFLEKVLQVESFDANLMIGTALALATPFFIVFGILSDRIGRKPIVMAGCVLAALTYFPAFKALTHFANPALDAAVASAPVRVVADPAECSFQFDPVGKKTFSRSCDVAKAALATAGVPYENEAAPAGTIAAVLIGQGDSANRIVSFEGAALSKADFKTADGFLPRTAERRAGHRRLSGQGRPGAGQSADGHTRLLLSRAAGDHGLRPDRRLAHGDVSHAHPLHLDVPALSHRQRLVRRLSAGDVVRHRGGHRRYLSRAVVSR